MGTYVRLYYSIPSLDHLAVLSADFLCDRLRLVRARVTAESLGSQGKKSYNLLPLCLSVEWKWVSLSIFSKLSFMSVSYCTHFTLLIIWLVNGVRKFPFLSTAVTGCVSCCPQEVYNYFRGSGKAAQLKREAAAGAFRASIWSGRDLCTPVRIVPYALDLGSS